MQTSKILFSNNLFFKTDPSSSGMHHEGIKGENPPLFLFLNAMHQGDLRSFSIIRKNSLKITRAVQDYINNTIRSISQILMVESSLKLNIIKSHCP